MDRECNNCHTSSWSKVFTDDYPERRRERDRTVKEVYVCTDCGKEGRYFTHNEGGADTVSGAFR